MKIVLFTILTLVASACGNKTETEYVEVNRTYSKCGDSFDRHCTEEETVYIHEIEYLARKLKSNSKQSSLRDNFHVHKTASYYPSKRVSIIGEFHNDPLAQMENFSLIEQEVRQGDRILFEGLKSDHWVDCSAMALMWLHCSLEWERSGNAYDPAARSHFCAPNWNQWQQVKRELQIHFLNIAKLEPSSCSGWEPTVEKEGVNKSGTEGLRYRNDSLIDTLKKFEFRNDRIFVVAGFYHSPVGEHYKLAENYYLKNADFSNFPDRLDGNYWEPRTLSALYAAFPDEVSTQGIHEHLEYKSAEYISHKRLVKNSNFLPY